MENKQYPCFRPIQSYISYVCIVSLGVNQLGHTSQFYDVPHRRNTVHIAYVFHNTQPVDDHLHKATAR